VLSAPPRVSDRSVGRDDLRRQVYFPDLCHGGRHGGSFATLEFIGWFNNRRLLEPIGKCTPAEAEERYYAQLEEIALAGVTQTKLPPANPRRFTRPGL
jgi:hypothetical protein